MYVRCGTCSWSQDDFWDRDYNPLRFLLNYEEELLDFNELDIEQFDLPGHPTKRQLITQAIRRAVEKVEVQFYLTPDQAKGSTCPQCGGTLVWD